MLGNFRQLMMGALQVNVDYFLYGCRETSGVIHCSSCHWAGAFRTLRLISSFVQADKSIDGRDGWSGIYRWIFEPRPKPWPSCGNSQLPWIP